MNSLTHKNERRKYERYDANVAVDYYYAYDFETKVQYEVVKDSDHKKFSVLSRNISAEGLSFTTDAKLEEGSSICLDVYVPFSESKIHMDAEVRRSQPISAGDDGAMKFDTGVRLLTANGKSIEETIYFDEKYDVMWSDVLESIVGAYRIISFNKTNELEKNHED